MATLRPSCLAPLARASGPDTSYEWTAAAFPSGRRRTRERVPSGRRDPPPDRATGVTGEDAAGELYIAGYSFTNGSIHRLVVAAGAGGPATGAEPSPLDLAPVRVGETASAELLVFNLNAGPEALMITDMALADTTRFAINPGGGSAPCGSVIPCLGPGQSCTVEITFSSPSPDSYATVLTLTGNSAPLAVPITSTSYEPCTLQPHRTLSPQTVSDTRLEQACLTVTAGPYAIVAPGDVTFLAGQRIVFRNGFSVGSGATFAAVIDPLLALP
jgi:hypothetical protein